jgi:predicted amidohydrolase YtcJ
VAVSDGCILAVGSAAEIAELAGSGTQVIDANGGTVLPGFSENHIHIFSGAAELDHLQVGGVHGLEGLTKAILDYAAHRPVQKFLFAQGCDYGILGDQQLDRHLLDAILRDQAILVMAADHQTAWANTAALDWSGILFGKEIAPGHEIVIGDDGMATGVLLEMEAFGPVQEAGGFDRYRPLLRYGIGRRN